MKYLPEQKEGKRITGRKVRKTSQIKQLALKYVNVHYTYVHIFDKKYV